MILNGVKNLEGQGPFERRAHGHHSTRFFVAPLLRKTVSTEPLSSVRLRVIEPLVRYGAQDQRLRIVSGPGNGGVYEASFRLGHQMEVTDLAVPDGRIP